MRFARFRRWGAITTAVLAAWIAAWIFGPQLGFEIPAGVFTVGVIVLVAIEVGLIAQLLVGVRGDYQRVTSAHPGAVVLATNVTAWPGVDRGERESVIAVVADRSGLSFRDHRDQEVLLLPSDRIISLEFAPLAQRSIRPLRVTTSDGGTFDFTGPIKPDAQVDAVVALRTALGRPAG